tara:strand:+ start:314 stop:664 length:351 start_codon:yes stop_codon:yes gene_type:complete
MNKSYTHIKGKDTTTKELDLLNITSLLNDTDKGLVSIVKMEVRGKLKWTRNNRSDIYYYILEGSGIYHFEDESIAVTEGDLVFIGKGTKYKDEGHFTVLGIANPQFRSEDTEFLEE